MLVLVFWCDCIDWINWMFCIWLCLDCWCRVGLWDWFWLCFVFGLFFVLWCVLCVCWGCFFWWWFNWYLFWFVLCGFFDSLRVCCRMLCDSEWCGNGCGWCGSVWLGGWWWMWGWIWCVEVRFAAISVTEVNVRRGSAWDWCCFNGCWWVCLGLGIWFWFSFWCWGVWGRRCWGVCSWCMFRRRFRRCIRRRVGARARRWWDVCIGCCCRVWFRCEWCWGFWKWWCWCVWWWWCFWGLVVRRVRSSTCLGVLSSFRAFLIYFVVLLLFFCLLGIVLMIFDCMVIWLLLLLLWFCLGWIVYLSRTSSVSFSRVFFSFRRRWLLFVFCLVYWFFCMFLKIFLLFLDLWCIFNFSFCVLVCWEMLLCFCLGWFLWVVVWCIVCFLWWVGLLVCCFYCVCVCIWWFYCCMMRWWWLFWCVVCVGVCEVCVGMILRGWVCVVEWWWWWIWWCVRCVWDVCERCVVLIECECDGCVCWGVWREGERGVGCYV